VVLYPRLDAGHVGEGFPANFTIDVWTGTEWATVVRRAGFANPGSAPVAFTFPVQSTDQLRIQGTDLSVMQLSELEAYQTAVAHDRDNLPIPTTTTTSTTTTTTAPPPPPPPPDPCHGPSSTPSFQSRVNLFTTTPARSGPYNGCASVGQSYTYSNPQWVWCRVWSDEVNDGNGNWNSYWLWTALDTGGMGWIPAYYTADEGNNQAFDIYTGRQIPDCGY